MPSTAVVGNLYTARWEGSQEAHIFNCLPPSDLLKKAYQFIQKRTGKYVFFLVKLRFIVQVLDFDNK